MPRSRRTRRTGLVTASLIVVASALLSLASSGEAGAGSQRAVVVRQHDEVVLRGTRIACFVERNLDPPKQPVGIECGKGFAKGSWQARSYGATIRINDEVELFQVDAFAQIPGTVFSHGRVPWPRIGVAGTGGRLVRVAVGDAFRLAKSHLVCNLRRLDVGAARTPTLLCEVLVNGRPPAAGSWAVAISDRLVTAVRFGAGQTITTSRAYRQP